MGVTPFQEGVVAAKCGADTTANPYRMGTDNHDAWKRGHAAVADALKDMLLADI